MLDDTQSIAFSVLKEYGIVPDNLSLVQGGTVKTVWKLSSRGRPLCLKRLKQTLDKALFSVNAQIYIRNSGGNVPGIILNKSEEPIVQLNGQLFVLYEWIDGNDLDFSMSVDLHKALQGLAHFHAASKGYTPAEHSRISSKLGKWPEQYESMKNKMLEWKKTADANSTQPHYKAYSSHAGQMAAMADLALEYIGRSDYNALTASGSKSIVLCHQDFGRGNVLAAPDGVYVLDLDGVTFDLPARDLRKIIGKNAENAGQWQAGTIRQILGWYSEINPVNEAETEVLYADLLFPHWFFGLVKNQFKNDKPVKASAIEKIARLEESKAPMIKALLDERGLWKP